MTARIVIFSTIHGRNGGRYHRESKIPGLPDCGVTLRRPTRAFATDDELLCRACWADETAAQLVAQTFDQGSESGMIVGTIKDGPAVFAHCDSGPNRYRGAAR